MYAFLYVFFSKHEFYTLMAQARAMDSMGLAGGEGDGVGNEGALNERTLHGLKNLKRLSRFVPEFYGTLREESIDVETLNADSKDIGDGGIGAMMFKDTSNAMVDAVARNKSSPRHCLAARETTSGVCGIRITGFQVHPQPSASPVNTGTNAVSKQLTPIITTKLYGKSLKKEQLPEGMRRVFPVLGEPVPIAIPETTSAAGSASSSGSSTPFEAYTSSTASSNVPYSDSTFKQPRTNLGLPPDLLLPILRSIHTSLTHLRSIMKGVELRMVGGSLLVVWEGDEQRAREGVEWMKEREIKITERIRQEADVEGNEDDDSEYIDSDDDDEGDTSSDEDNENVSAHEPSPDGAGALTDETNIASKSKSKPSSKSHRRKPSAPYALSLIDFAHTRFVPGQGPDVGVLLGLDTFAKLIEGRILEVEDIEVGRQGSK
ncbi:SAICAR synthase-like protein [Lentinula edodes]|uniref:Kinase n=1 Tax=Lentinula edodes TaxID=5353 RepID=A0A1Q3DXS6_LENED|nr:SAICAR synthase-like protein [Lentinula edodes]